MRLELNPLMTWEDFRRLYDLYEHLESDDLFTYIDQDSHRFLMQGGGALAIVLADDLEFPGVAQSETVGTGIVNIVQKGIRRYGIIDDVVTDPRCERRGIRSDIVIALREHAIKKMGCNYVELTCSKKHAKALPGYLKLDFVIRETNVLRYSPPD